ncbi:MAG TPA: phenylalanine--tRNA ligase subunit beta [Patescibacteria group bacterium]|nr:phenylalanine--tRNA ligase subunit beta [Patescibacteria group bacterium]
MIAPLSWLKEYISITIKPEELGEKLTEIGLGTERIRKENNDVIFDLEITPNRPDWLSMIGVAREIAAIEKGKVAYPKLKTDLIPKKGVHLLPLTIHPDFFCSQRMTGIIIHHVSVKDSPEWLKKKLLSIGLRPINNIVDITNFVMWELGNPIHAFDYEKIAGHEMWVKQAKGGEVFESVDGISYHLPKEAIIYEDSEKIFDLAGIKGGKNSGTYSDTKTVFILVPVNNPVLIRRASQALSLRSDASAIFERAVNKGGTIDALKRTVDLILELAGGEIASHLIDLKEKEFIPWEVSLRLERLAFVLGIKIPDKEVIDILRRLHLAPTLHHSTAKGQDGNSIIMCTIPTYRNDLQIEEDLIEEVARLYGYNNFPKTLPEGQIPTVKIPFYKNYREDEKVKEFLVAAGFTEIYTYSLVSEKDLAEVGVNSEKVLRIDNPVSRDYEYLRPTLKINLLKAFDQNKVHFDDINLFELGKVYCGSTASAANDINHLAGITLKKSYREIKGVLERLFKILGSTKDPTKYIEILENGIYFEISYMELVKDVKQDTIFQPISKYPPASEDLTIAVSAKVKTGDIITTIKKQNTLIASVTLLDWYQNTRTFHIIYQSLQKNLTTEEVANIRGKILVELKEKFEAKQK